MPKTVRGRSHKRSAGSFIIVPHGTAMDQAAIVPVDLSEDHLLFVCLLLFLLVLETMWSTPPRSLGWTRVPVKIIIDVLCVLSAYSQMTSKSWNLIGLAGVSSDWSLPELNVSFQCNGKISACFFCSFSEYLIRRLRV